MNPKTPHLNTDFQFTFSREMGTMLEEKPNESGSEELSNEEEVILEVEEEPEQVKDYKHLKARLIEQKKNAYRIEFIEASHGFLNYLTNILLKEKGVEYAAYKKTTLGNPIMTIFTDGSVSVKKILQNSGKKINDELNAIQDAFKTAIK